MSSRKRKNAKRRTRSQKSSRSRTYLLLAGAIAVAVVAVAVIVLLDQGASPSAADASGTASEKTLGAADALVVVVEYGDFQCPYCQIFAEGAGQQLREEYVDTGQVRLVYRHLAFIGDESTWAAEASECANEQDRFWDYHDKLYEEQAGENEGAFAKDNLKRFAAELGLDTERFDQCFDARTYRDQVQADINDARQRRINATPSLLVDGQYIQNGANYQVLQAAIEAALAQP
jgi:protein-disulfide isomerase